MKCSNHSHPLGPKETKEIRIASRKCDVAKEMPAVFTSQCSHPNNSRAMDGIDKFYVCVCWGTMSKEKKNEEEEEGDVLRDKTRRIGWVCGHGYMGR